MNSRLFPVGEPLEQGIWLQAVKQVLDFSIVDIVHLQDIFVQLADLSLLAIWHSLRHCGLYTLSNFDDNGCVVAEFFDNTSKLILLNFLFVLPVLFFDFVRSLLVLFDILVDLVSPVCEDDEEEEENESEPSLSHGHVIWSHTGKAEVQPDVGKEGGD
jgi:hypothetical protein